MRFPLPHLLGATLAVAACAEPEPAMTQSNDQAAVVLDGTSWTLKDLAGQSAAPGTTPTMQFEGGTISGTDGCNRYNGGYEVEGNAFRLTGSMMSTQMACPDEIMSFAQAYLAALTDARTVRLDGDDLVMQNAGAATVATFAPVSQSLAGTSWTITNLNNGKAAVTGVIAETNLALNFVDEKSVAGSSGCNRFSGSYTQDGETITIGPLAVTRMMCAEPEGVMEQETLCLRALEAARVLRVEGNRLELRNETGALQIGANRSED
ncbi:MAG: META domain-containing protein [Planctomycetota bacterium]